MIFGDFDEKYRNPETAKTVLIPVPFDLTSTWIKGADQGPKALLNASHQLENFDIETRSEAYKTGIYCQEPVTADTVEQLIPAVKHKVAEQLIKEKFPVVIGGEHSVSIGAIQASREKYPDLSVVQLDAHADLRQEYHGSQYNHACVMARVRELCPFIEVGIRSMDSSESQLIDSDRLFFAENIRGKKDWIPKALSKLTEKVYITLDLDVFDPSIMASTGTPEPGGLLWYEVLGFVRQIFQQKNVVGFDIVELCPNENNKAPDFLAAKLLYKMLTYKFML